MSLRALHKHRGLRQMHPIQYPQYLLWVVGWSHTHFELVAAYLMLKKYPDRVLSNLSSFHYFLHFTCPFIIHYTVSLVHILPKSCANELVGQSSNKRCIGSPQFHRFYPQSRGKMLLLSEIGREGR